jgi:hypothetical protein
LALTALSGLLALLSGLLLAAALVLTGLLLTALLLLAWLLLAWLVLATLLAALIGIAHDRSCARLPRTPGNGHNARKVPGPCNRASGS